MHSIYKTITHYLYHPLFLVLVIPLSYLLIGTLYAGQYSSFNFIRFFLLYSFIFLNHLLGNFLFKTIKSSFSFNHIPFLLFEVLNLLLIYYFADNIHYLVGLLCFFYSLVIHLQFYLVKQGYSWLMLFFSSVFKGGILTYLSFFVQANFIPNTLFYWSIPLILMVFLVELGKLQLNYTRINGQLNEHNSNNLFLDHKHFQRIVLYLLILIYVVSFILFIPTFKSLSFIFILTLPFTIKVVQLSFSTKESISAKLTQRTLQLCSIAFFISFSIMLFIYNF